LLEPVSVNPPFPVVRPVIRQSWVELTFLHWRFDPAVVRPLVPMDLELDLWEGHCYVGLIPFILSGITLVNAPEVPWLSHFNETNVRTYVRDRHGRRGVWFFSLDAARLAAVVGARATYNLPYFWAAMSVAREGGQVVYRSKRRHGPPAHSDIAVTPGAQIAVPAPLDAFLTARWCLFAHRNGRTFRADIEHPRWPLQRAAVNRLDESLIRAAGLPQPAGEPLAHFSPGVSVLTGWPKQIV
jgi:uncharacterized protein YqjF (DUF2071 family)